MNYIVGRLIQVVDEEEAFWIFVIIMETYLPIDYMTDGLLGAILDQKVFEHLISYKHPKLIERMKNLSLH